MKVQIGLQGVEDPLLWHGTTATSPLTIAKDGFDTRLSKDGSLWGRGSYFAHELSFSDRYAHRLDMSPESDSLKVYYEDGSAIPPITEGEKLTICQVSRDIKVPTNIYIYVYHAWKYIYI